MIALRRDTLMKADPAVSLLARRLFSGRANSCKRDASSWDQSPQLGKKAKKQGQISLVPSRPRRFRM